jgi:hypothetical protein
MHLPGRESSALMLAALFILVGTGNVVRGQNTPPSVSQSSDKEIETKEVQPPVKTTEPWEITVGGPGWLANASGITGFHGLTPMSVSMLDRFSGISTSFMRSTVRSEGGDLVYLAASST